MTLLNVADMFADVLGIEDIYAGNINGNLDRCIGVYNAKNSSPHKICIGGKACTKTEDKQISILIHWTDNPSAAEQKANDVLESIIDIGGYAVGDFVVDFIKCNDPVPVGRDERGICEYVIEATIYYERKD
ncbi:MAG: minor capsid protein [Oscillospiraceae bacterium]